MVDLSTITAAVKAAATELIEAAALKPGQILVAGCSTSEITGQKIGTASSLEVGQAVVEATKIGYRHIDTAQAYNNENGVGEGIRASGLKRDDIFVTTKLAAEVKDYQKAVSSIDQSLKTMKLDHIDMMIIHSPQPWMKFGGKDRYFEGNREAWRALEEAYKAGKLRA
ncbi:MAG: hypothetical protein PWP70_1862, partial [Moorella sp. (in: firmicutes)]|nr:hypothetical protein [Moorella sp. (in: firmicutes)]